MKTGKKRRSRPDNIMDLDTEIILQMVAVVLSADVLAADVLGV